MINFTQNTDVIINEFLRSLTQQNLSPVTVKNYKSDINFFQNWLHSTTPDSSSLPIPQLITPKTLNNFHQYISGNLTPKTANRRLSAIRKFCQYLSAQNYTSANSANHLPNITSPHHLNDRHLDLDQISTQHHISANRHPIIPTFPPAPTPSSPPTTHYLFLLIIVPLLVFIITFIILALLTPPPQLLTPTF